MPFPWLQILLLYGAFCPLAGNKIPASVKVFLAALAIINDIGAIIVIALFYTKTVLLIYLLCGLGIWGLLFVLNRCGIRSLWLYLVPGVVMWCCFLQSGVHATISGVMLAFDDAGMITVSKLSILTGSALSAITGLIILRRSQ